MGISRDEYAALDATALAELVHRGEVSAVELVNAAIDCLEAVNATLNAAVTPMYEQARAAAEDPVTDGPFAGVPFLMKDYCAEVAGVPFTEASAFLRDYVPAEDSVLYRRFRDAGLITVAKTNLPEFAIGATTEPRLFGPTRNPWNVERTPGGSSGGSAAAVAARVVPMAHGNDVGGSIRIPASCCGLVGLKPSRGRTTLAPEYGDILAGFFVEHALTRSVRDCAALLDAVAGPAPGDPYHAPLPARQFRDEVGRDPGRLRIAFSTDTPAGEAVHPDCAAAVRETAAALASAGHDLEEASPAFDHERLWRGFTTMLASGAAWAMADWGRRTGRTPSAEDFEPFVWAFADCDLFLTPTLGEPPVPLGTLVFDGDPFELRRRTARFSPYTYITNASGQPAMSLPLHWNDAGLPVGVQLVARYADEAMLFRVAAQLEQARPWADRRPPVCA